MLHEVAFDVDQLSVLLSPASIVSGSAAKKSIVTGGGGLIPTVKGVDDQPDSTLVCVAHRACALTSYVPGFDQLWLAEVEDDQLEYVPSSQSKRYWSEWPWLETAPPVLYEYDVLVSPLVGPEGMLGVLTVSGSVIATDLLEEKLETTVVCVEHRACALTE